MSERPNGGCRDHAAHIEECMGCNGGRWDSKAADELIEAGYAVGITAAALRVAKVEIERLRAMEERIEAWATDLEAKVLDGDLAASEIRRRMAGP